MDVVVPRIRCVATGEAIPASAVRPAALTDAVHQTGDQDAVS
jgi:hypothetical protein